MSFVTIRRLLAPWVSACVLLAAGCGGGGSDGGGDDGAFRVSLSQSSVQLTYEVGTRPPVIELVATWSGKAPEFVYLGAIVEGEGIDPSVPVFLSGTHADISLRARPGLAAGLYTGRVLALVCSDPNCTRRVGGTPLPIAYTVTVTPAVSIVPASLTFTAVENTAVPMQSLVMTLPAGHTVDPLVAPQYINGPVARFWLSVTRTATGYNVSADTATLPQGVYTGALHFMPQPPAVQFDVPVTLTVGPR